MSFAVSQGAFAEALLDPERPVPAGVTTARGGIDAARFAVYRNNVFVGLTQALARRFPVTERLVGTEFFAGMARVYAQERKPDSPLIFTYGDDFPDFVAGFAPAKDLAYLPDVARIEAAWTHAYHAADVAPLELATLAAIQPEMLPVLRLVPHPSAGLVRSQHPVGSIWAAHQSDAVRPVADWKPETMFVVRPDMTVEVHILPPHDAAFAAAILGGATLGDAAETALAKDKEFDFGAALVGLVTLGAFCALRQDEGNVP